MKSREGRDLERQISLLQSQFQAEVRRLGIMYEAEILKLNDRISELEAWRAFGGKV